MEIIAAMECSRIILVIVLVVSSHCALSQHSKSIKPDNTELTESRPVSFTIKFSDDYDKKTPPQRDDQPAVVKIDVSPWKIGEISIERMTFEVDLYMTVYWEDHRLTFLGVDDVPSWRRIVINPEEAQSIWKPVLGFRNVMGSKAMSFEPDFVHIRLSKNTLFYVLRKVEKFHCPFDLKNYPLDVQSCSIEIQALTYKSVVVLQDNTTVHELRGQSDPPQFQIKSHHSGNCTREDGASRFYSCIEYGFVLRRQLAHHLMLTYAPSFLIVLLSWISFWLDVQATPARIGLGLTSLLTLATQFSNAQKNLPAVAYIKALDIWMFTCIFMVFGSMTEFAIANYNARCSKQSDVVPIKQVRVSSAESTTSTSEKEARKRCNISADRFSRFAFPSVFSLFNLCYWIYYGNQ